MPQPTYKAVEFELLDTKAAADGWTFSGYASTFGNIDDGGDVVLPGAFTDSLKTRPKPRLLWQHDSHEPLGVVLSMKEDARGLLGEWKISKTQRGADAYALLKDGAVDSLSIGYIPTDSEFTDDGVRKLKSVELLEVSLVSIPMNAEALVTSVKAQLSVHVDRVLADVRELTSRCQRLAALRAEDGRKESATVCRVREELPTELKALAAEVEALLCAAPEATSPADEAAVSRTADAQPSITQMRLRLLEKNLARRGYMEYASA